MGAFKKLNKQDAYISTYTAHKTWAVTGSDFSNYGISIIVATGSYLNSLRQLYYPSKSQDNIVSHSYDYYDQTTLYSSQSRTIGSAARIISIPKTLFGTNIQANGSITVELDNSNARDYVNEGYWSGSYTQTITTYSKIIDNGEGTLLISGSSHISVNTYIGDVIYSHGMVILTNQAVDSNNYLNESSTVTSLQFNSSHPIYTHNYHCRVRESEFNFTNNPSAVSSSVKTIYDNQGDLYLTGSKVSDGVIKSNLTGSSFQPYITTVGLYNDANQLIAVGKMSQPVPKPANTEMTIIVKIDI